MYGNMIPIALPQSKDDPESWFAAIITKLAVFQYLFMVISTDLGVVR